MDTQRLILAAIFLCSGFFLWERWQSEHQAPVPAVAQSAPKATDTSSAVPGATPALTAAVPGAAPANAPTGHGEIIPIKTDRYAAEVDTLGGVVTEVALAAHRDTDNADKPYVLLQRNENRTFLAES